VRRHVMVVEDDESLLPLIARTLEIEGYRVTRASCGADALAHLRTGVPDLIVSDIMMPEMDGFELLERLRVDSRLHGVPVVFLTALGDQESIERGHRLGVDHYLVKPFTPAQLLATVTGTLRRYAELRTGGVIPALPAAAPATVPGMMPTGVVPVDEQVGGLAPGRVYLASGDFGAAKHVLALQMLAAAVARGDRALLVTTERLDTVLYLATSVGLPLRDAVRSGQLIVCGLADGFEQLLETREDVVALGAEIAEWAVQNRCTHVAMTGVLTVLCSTPRLPLSAPLMSELVGGLEHCGATTVLVADEPVTPSEELAEAYLRRAVFGTLGARKDASSPGRGVLTLEAMRGITGDPGPKTFRIRQGLGLIAVDPAAEVDVHQCLQTLRHDADVDGASAADQVAAVVPRKPAGWRMRDPFALFLRDCLATARRASTECALVLVYVPQPALREASAGPSPGLCETDLQGVLTPQEVLCWLRPTELAVVAIGSARSAAVALADRLATRVDQVLRARQVPRTARTAVVHSEDGETLDPLLAALERQLATPDAPDATQPAVA